MSNEREFLIWLADRDEYWIADSLVEEKFPNIEFEMIGVTKRCDPESGEVQTPKRDLRQAVQYGGVTD